MGVAEATEKFIYGGKNHDHCWKEGSDLHMEMASHEAKVVEKLRVLDS